MMQQTQAPKNPNFEQKILAELAAIKQRLDERNTQSEESIGKLIQPKEICERFDIARNTLEKFFLSGLLTPLRLSPESRKIYVAESQLNQIFKSQLDQNR